ncbi:N-acetylglucosamine-6-phosphate deacetylase [Virgibacillus halodenitrificans]|uniref:N-acetylglucosamine-6-phosphate deacetylase n=1 Tax=Virgibacillus halodenitrificans TaxID=1482 RepID=UPI00031038C7|nr:N-acetylglucosamine-6-phosphate deacetylase [Virgibacillus halodenitrificans]
MDYIIKASRFLLENGERTDSYLAIKDHKFAGFVDEVPNGVEIKDWGDSIVAPGLFDTHIHGIAGFDIMDGVQEAVRNISEEIAKIGVTRFLPTTLTSSRADLEKAIIAVRQAVVEGLPGAVSEGIFLEGPYFTEKHKGAQNPSYFTDPSLKEFEHWQELAEGSIVKIALAPEREGAEQFIQTVTNSGVLASIAHTDASYTCCVDAVEAGARNFVHLFNGMSGLHHREPGVAGAALTLADTYAEIICDGFHVHPEVASMAYQLKGNKLQLITDCMRAGLMPDGKYHLGEFPVVMQDGVARTETGSLAGSTLRLMDGVQNLSQWTGKNLSEIWHLGSLSPAKSLNKDKQLGSIQSGKYADYVVLSPSMEVIITAVNGEIVYEK